MLAQAAIAKYRVDLVTSQGLDSGRSEIRVPAWLALVGALCASLGKLNGAHESSPLGSTGNALSLDCAEGEGGPLWLGLGS